MSQQRPPGDLVPDPTASLAPALWSVYFHAIHLPTLRPSVFSRVMPPPDVEPPGGPRPLLDLVPLHEAIGVLREGQGSHARMRRLRALRKLASAGLVNRSHREALAVRAASGRDEAYVELINVTGAAVEDLLQSVEADWPEAHLGAGLPIMSPQDAEGYIDGALMGLNACVPVGASCMACYVPRGAPGAEPMTSVHASAFVKRDLAGLARAFDPRSWSTCAPEAFQKSQRVTYSETTLEYADVPHSPSDLGNPWTGLLEENVVVGGTATFQNWLEIDFTVEKTSGGVQLVRVDYELFESGAFSIPAFWISNEVESVTLDEGHLLAEPSTHVSYPASDGWVYVRMVKRVRFVDLTDVTGTDPWQLDPGEVLNYWAPVALGAWLEAGTQGFVCCNP